MTGHDANTRAAWRFLGAWLIVGGVAIQVAIVAFVWIALGFRQTWTSSWGPVEDLVMAFGVLGAIMLGGVGLIWLGWRLLRRA